jgi:D-sedoheptulose 7-phosphate isomerase
MTEQFSTAYRRYIAGIDQGLAGVDVASVARAVDMIDTARREGHLVLLAGNGGSAATANHFACDLSKNVAPPGAARIRTVSLSSLPEAITAYGNDVDFESVFTLQAEGLTASPGDVVIVISASGTSPDIVSLVRSMRESGRTVIAFTGFDGGPAGAEASVNVHVPLRSYEQIEDAHSILLHMIVVDLKRRAALPDGQSRR